MRSSLLHSLLTLALTTSVYAQQPPGLPLETSQQIVNVTTIGIQELPRVATGSDGAFVVVWNDYTGRSIRSRRIEPDGSSGPEQVIMGGLSSSTGAPDIAAIPDGRFVVTWRDGSAVDARFLGSDGSPVGDEFLVWSNGLPLHPRVDASADQLVFVWDNSGDIEAVRRDKDGFLLGGSGIDVNNRVTGLQERPDVAVRADGSFVVVWQSAGSDGADNNGTSVQARRFQADGSPIGFQTQINQFRTSGNQGNPSIDMRNNGDYVIAWDGPNQDGHGIDLRRFLADGTSLSSFERFVNRGYLGDQTHPTVFYRESGGLLVAWQSERDENSVVRPSILINRLAPIAGTDSLRLHADQRLDTGFGLTPSLPAVAANRDRFITVWNHHTSSIDVASRLAILPVFIGDFEDGHAFEWTAVVEP